MGPAIPGLASDGAVSAGLVNFFTRYAILPLLFGQRALGTSGTRARLEQALSRSGMMQRGWGRGTSCLRTIAVSSSHVR